MKTLAKLYVEIASVLEDDEGIIYPGELPAQDNTWAVSVGGETVLWGFARQRDAEVALQFLESLDIDWNKEMFPQLIPLGYHTRQELMRAVCERLGW